MSFKPPLDKLGPEHLSGEQTGSGEQPSSHDRMRSSLLRALATFSSNRVSAVSTMQALQSSDPSGLARAAVQLLMSGEEKSSSWQAAAGLLTTSGLLVHVLMNQHVLSLEEAVALARKATRFDPRLDLHLVQNVMANMKDGVGSIASGDALRLLGLVDAISDCLLLASSLVQFLRHPSDKVRSKAALLLGRSNWNLNRMETLMASADARLRANAVESLWEQQHEQVRRFLWNATHDECGRVVVNALLGLCKAGDREAYARLADLADAPEPVMRSSAAWAMGESGDLKFAEALEKLTQDGDPKVRDMAQRSWEKLRR